MKRIKKLAAIGLAALLLVGSMSSLAVFAANDEPVSLFKGGGVESATLNEDGSVNSFGGHWYTNFLGATLETEEVHSGNKAIKLTGNEADNTKQGAMVYGAWPASKAVDSFSEVKGYVKVESLSEGSYVRIRVYQYSRSNGYQVFTKTMKESGDWEIFSYPFAISAYSAAYIEFCVFGTGVAYVDDVSVIDSDSLIPHTFNSNWISSIPKQSASANMATTDNFRLDTAVNFEGESSLYLGTTDSHKNPVIYYTFGARNMPVPGENYRFSFRFKPAEEGAKPLAYIGAVASGYISAQYATFNPGYTLIKGDVQNGWQEYHAYFTMPEATKAVFCLRGGVGNNGWYDSFSLVRDYEENVKVVNDADVEVKTAAVGETLSLQAHVISEIAEADGGENITLLVAAYNGQGILQCVDVACYAETVNKGTSIDAGIEIAGSTPKKNFVTAAKDVTFDYTIPESAAGCTLKAFCWNGGSLKPMGSSYKVTVAAK